VNVLILDDEKSSRLVISHLLADGVPEVELIYEAADFETAQSILLKKTVDVLLIDIGMPEGTGFDFLDMLDYSRYSVIFVTAHKEYALEAVKYRAFDYLLKPISQLDLIKVFSRIKDETVSPVNTSLTSMAVEENKIDITTDTGHVIQHINNILYIQSAAHNSIVKLTSGQELASTKSIGYYEKLLSLTPFFRVHNTYLINLQKVAAYNLGDLEITLVDGETVPLAKRKKSLFVKELKEIIIT
jgi:two-component system LytT family response regulator